MKKTRAATLRTRRPLIRSTSPSQQSRSFTLNRPRIKGRGIRHQRRWHLATILGNKALKTFKCSTQKVTLLLCNNSLIQWLMDRLLSVMGAMYHLSRTSLWQWYRRRTAILRKAPCESCRNPRWLQAAPGRASEGERRRKRAVWRRRDSRRARERRHPSAKCKTGMMNKSL